MALPFVIECIFDMKDYLLCMKVNLGERSSNIKFIGGRRFSFFISAEYAETC
jgi:hypothetical protein